MTSQHPIPMAMATRPIDPRRGLPIPFINETDDGAVEFAAIQSHKVLACARGHLCGICGNPLGYWMAFIGGPRSASTRAYLDPPSHPECGIYAMNRCPHIARREHQRAPAHRIGPDVITPAEMTEDKPSHWVMGLCRGFEARVIGARTAQAHVLFMPHPFKFLRTWHYGPDGRLIEQPQRRAT